MAKGFHDEVGMFFISNSEHLKPEYAEIKMSKKTMIILIMLKIIQIKNPISFIQADFKVRTFQ